MRSETYWLGRRSTSADSLLRFSLGDAYSYFSDETDARRVAEALPPGTRIVFVPERHSYALSMLATECQVIAVASFCLSAEEAFVEQAKDVAKAFDSLYERLGRKSETASSIYSSLTGDALLGAATITKRTQLDAGLHEMAQCRSLLDSATVVEVPQAFMHALPLEACTELITKARGGMRLSDKPCTLGYCETLTVQNAYRLFALHACLPLVLRVIEILSEYSPEGKDSLKKSLTRFYSEGDLKLLRKQAKTAIGGSDPRNTDKAVVLLLASCVSVFYEVVVTLLLHMALPMPACVGVLGLLYAQHQQETEFYSSLRSLLERNLPAAARELATAFSYGVRLLSGPPWTVGAFVDNGVLTPEGIKKFALESNDFRRSVSSVEDAAEYFQDHELGKAASALYESKMLSTLQGIPQPLGCPELFGCGLDQTSSRKRLEFAQHLFADDGKEKTLSAKVIRTVFCANDAPQGLREGIVRMISHTMCRNKMLLLTASVDRKVAYKELQAEDTTLEALAPLCVWRRDAASIK